METLMLAGGCHCGAVRYEMLEKPERHSLCHCTDCRRSAGAPAVAWAILPEDRLRVTKGTPRVRASSDHARRHFCGDCGTGLFYASAAIFPGMIDVQSATLDDPDAIPGPSEHIQTAERIGWMHEAHHLPDFERYPDIGG